MYSWSDCKEGWYGVNCSQRCSGHCRDSTVCNHLTGKCDGGCDAGWTDNLCDKGKVFNLIKALNWDCLKIKQRCYTCSYV